MVSLVSNGALALEKGALVLGKLDSHRNVQVLTND